MRFYLYILFFLVMGLGYAQTKQVIILQHKYDFQTEPDSYNINNMFKGILLAEDFDVYFDDEELPLYIAQNRCNAINGIVLDNSNVFSTKLKFVLKDCQNKTLFESAEVKSKEKNIQSGYIEALKLFSPELKKYKATMIQKKEVVAIPPAVVSSSIAKHQFVQIANGFAIMDANLKVVLQIYNTTNPSVFIADKFGIKGIFTKVDNKGIFEYYSNDKLVVEEYLF